MRQRYKWFSPGELEKKIDLFFTSSRKKITENFNVAQKNSYHIIPCISQGFWGYFTKLK